MKAPAKVTFSWKNYFRPTPDNLQYFATGIRGLFVVITSTSILMHAGEVINLACIATGYLLDELIKFFGRAAHDYALTVTETTTTTQKETKIEVSAPEATENPSPSE